MSNKCVQVDGKVQEMLEEVLLMQSAWDVPQDQAAMRNWRNPGACFWSTEEALSHKLHQN